MHVIYEVWELSPGPPAALLLPLGLHISEEQLAGGTDGRVDESASIVG